MLKNDSVGDGGITLHDFADRDPQPHFFLRDIDVQLVEGLVLSSSRGQAYRVCDRRFDHAAQAAQNIDHSAGRWCLIDALIAGHGGDTHPLHEVALAV